MYPVMHGELDDTTADRLLDLVPDDVPPGYEPVASALQATALMASQAPTQEAGTAVAAFLDAIPTRRTQRMKKWKIAAATLAGGLSLSTGLAAADVLPGAAQDAASEALAKVGISVPGKHNDKANTRGKSAENKAAKVEADSPTSTTKPANHGSVVSDVARDKTTVGADHGAAVCATASGGKCQTGTQGKAGGEQPDTTVTTNANRAGGTTGNSTGASNSTGSANSSSTGSSNSGGTSSGGSTNSSGGNSSTVSSGGSPE